MLLTLPTLSIRAPWWWWIVDGGNDIENRDWMARYRGPLLIHASKWWNLGEVRFDQEDATAMARRAEGLVPSPPALEDLRAAGGHIVGLTYLSDVVGGSDSPWFVGRYGFVLRGARPVEPFAVKGQLGFFDVEVPSAHQAAIERQLDELEAAHGQEAQG